MKKILIDLTQIPKEKVGVGVYAINTFSAIGDFDSNAHYYLLVQKDEVEFDCSKRENVTVLKLGSILYRKFFLRFFIEQIYLPYLIIKFKINILHSLHYSFPLISFGAKRVITIHDLTFFVYPKLHTIFKRYYFKFFISITKYLKTNLIFVSQSTSEDYVKYIGRSLNCVATIPLATNITKIKSCSFKNINEKFHLKDGYVLFIGTLEPRKNIGGLIDAFAKISDKIDQNLVVVGKRGWYYNSIFETVDRFRLNSRISFLGFVTEEEKKCLIEKCDVFVYPSFYEGFGLPVLEAITLNIPTITSSISSLPEVAGDAAILVDPTDIDNLSDTIYDVLTNEKLKQKLIINSKMQADKFSWKLTTKRTINFYEDIC